MSTIEERRARDAARKRAARARAREERERTSGAVKSTPAPRTMRDALESSLSAMKWLKDSDAASVAQARLLAKDVDELEHAGSVVRALSAHRALSKVLSDLAGTPAMRMQHELRSARLAQKQGGDGDDKHSADAKPSSNVSQFRRPARRRRA
jgi:hypothetical protein